MGTYQTYNIKNVIDGNYATKFWSDKAQKAGEYIQLDFGSSAARYQITLHFTEGDTPTGEAQIQFSDDTQSWTTISTFTSSDISDKLFVAGRRE